MKNIVYKLTDFVKRNPTAVIISAIIFITLGYLLTLDRVENVFQSTFDFVTTKSRVFVGLSQLLMMGWLIYLMLFSKFGRTRIGGEKAKTEFSTLSWLSMLFMCGMGIGLLYYGVAEPLYHTLDNPFNDDPANASRYGLALSFMDWGLHPWTLYCVLGVIIAYVHFNKNRAYKISSIFPKSSPTWLKKSVDIISALGVLAGLSTSLGLGVSQMSAGMTHVFGWAINEYVLIIVIGLIAIWSLITGFKKGIKWLSNITMTMTVMILVVVLIAQASRGMNISYFTYAVEGISTYISEFIRFSNPFNEDSAGWSSGWFMFYQLWFASWAIFVSIFAAKISRGRTYRGFIGGVIFMPLLITIIWFTILGGTAAGMPADVQAVIIADLNTSIFDFVKYLMSNPYFNLFSGFIIVTVALSFITGADSGSYVVATLASEKSLLSNGTKIYWGSVQILMAVVLFYCGGLVLIQTASTITGVLVIVVILIGMVLMSKSIYDDRKKVK